MNKEISDNDRSFPHLDKRLPLIVYALICMMLLITPLTIISYGYTPYDDVLRHAAKIIAEKDWGEILLLRDTIPPDMDTHPGWHTILGVMHRAFNLDGDGLVVFSIVSLWLVFTIIPLFYFTRPEAFILVLLCVGFLDFSLINRLFWGRPFVLTAFTALSLCYLWDRMVGITGNRLHEKQRSITPVLWIIVLTGLASWIHSTWYLLFIPVFSAYCTRNRRYASILLCATVCGIILGGTLTGNPADYLLYQVKHLYYFMTDLSVSGALTGETSPGKGSPLIAAFALGLILLNRKTTGRYLPDIHGIAFYLMITGWLLGFFILRFWTDFGFPAFVYWASLSIQRLLHAVDNENAFKRLSISIMVGILFFYTLTHNSNGRWSTSPYRQMDHLKRNYAEYELWLPEDNGIIYSVNMQVFYNFFFLSPRANWRYVLGFEHAIMPKEDLEIYNSIRSKRNYSSFLPWVKKMTLKDRIIVQGGPEYPDLPLLKWKWLPPHYWIGRLP